MNEEAEAIIDMYDLLATRIREDWTDPRSQLRAMWDLHDLWHSLNGGDSTRSPWPHLESELYVEMEDPLVAEDVIRRMKIVLAGDKL
jgi:hypothetical protein